MNGVSAASRGSWQNDYTKVEIEFEGLSTIIPFMSGIIIT